MYLNNCLLLALLSLGVLVTLSLADEDEYECDEYCGEDCSDYYDDSYSKRNSFRDCVLAQMYCDCITGGGLDITEILLIVLAVLIVISICCCIIIHKIRRSSDPSNGRSYPVIEIQPQMSSTITTVNQTAQPPYVSAQALPIPSAPPIVQMQMERPFAEELPPSYNEAIAIAISKES